MADCCMCVQPWYATAASEPVVDGNSIADHGQGIVLTAGTDLLAIDSDVKKRSKHTHKHKRPDKAGKKEKPGKSGMKSLAELRQERQVREQKERQLQQKLLHAHRGVR